MKLKSFCFTKKKWFRSRFDSVQWSFSCFTGHIYFSHHNLDGMQLSSAQQTRRPRTIWCHSKSNRSWLFPFGEQASVFFSLFTIAIIHPANISLFVLHIVCCFISFFHFFFFSLFIHLMRSIRAVILFMHINKSHSCRVDFSIGFKTATQQFSKSMQSVCETYVSPNHAPDRNACSVYI